MEIKLKFRLVDNSAQVMRKIACNRIADIFTGGAWTVCATGCKKAAQHKDILPNE